MAKAQPYPDTTIKAHYVEALSQLDSLLRVNGSFKEAVYTVENAYFRGQLDRDQFLQPIELLTKFCVGWRHSNLLTDYRYPDSVNFQKNFSIYRVMKDTVRLKGKGDTVYSFVPFRYEFDDFAGASNWPNMFVSKLLVTRKGNCHSLPYLYKILADETGATCWLSVAPNHIYIKNRSKEHGWYNTELTSGVFPVDAWITASGYIPLEAIQNGIYMDTLSNVQSLALCLLDLAKGYEFQTGNYSDSFLLQCSSLALQYYPLCVQALLLKAETLKRIYEQERAVQARANTTTYREMEGLYLQLFELGYREMPDSMYRDWLRSLEHEKHKYTNQQIGARK